MKSSAASAPLVRPSPSQIETLASAIHETYRELGRRNGWLKSKDDKGFADMHEPTDLFTPVFDDAKVEAWKKQSNREAALRIPPILARAGLRLESDVSSAPDALQVRIQIESLLELLAKTEHTGWMEWHFQFGWKYNKKRDDKAKLHDQLLPYHQLNDENKNKDRFQVRHFPEFAAGAKMQIVFA